MADNIAAFGGDPEAVTIWGQSAGAMSVFDQLALFDGNNTYKGCPLFRAAIMDSGSITPTEPVNGVKAQAIFDTVVEAAGVRVSDKFSQTRMFARGRIRDLFECIKQRPRISRLQLPGVQLRSSARRSDSHC